MDSQRLLEVNNLCQRFHLNRRKTTIYAVERLSLQIRPAEILGLVGESGCGKSTSIRAIAQLHRPHSGEVWFQGKNLCALKGRKLVAARRQLQIVFQDPAQSLNPQLTVNQIIAEPLQIQQAAGLIKHEASARKHMIEQIMTAVGLSPQMGNRFPHEFSGGQKQRVAIARALIVQPQLILLDEPISALDVSIQAQVVNLLENLQQQFQLSYLFVAHDLAMVRYLCHRTAVMYAGHLVEEADSNELHHKPLHPYTQSLLQAIPIPDPQRARERRPEVIGGEASTADSLSNSCPFVLRCKHAHQRCQREKPPLRQIDGQRRVACWLHQ